MENGFEDNLGLPAIFKEDATVYGFYGRILRINLSEKSYEIKDVEEKIYDPDENTWRFDFMIP